MPSEGNNLTPEKLAHQEARKLKKQRKKAELAASDPPSQTEDNGAIVFRPWVTVQLATPDSVEPIKLMTWNLLAQCLVRRTLFPTSDCLKAHQRENMLYREILAPGADIICLQEADRLNKLIPILGSSGYAHVYAAGPGKLHGCIIAYRDDIFERSDATVIQYDEVDVRSEGSENARKGLSFRTRNIASIVSLKRKGSADDGIVVATTHLFWRPSYYYERARQAGLLMRETLRFRDSSGHPNWPCVLAGDFNFLPIDPTYSLLAGDQLLPEQEDHLARSRVVHVSVDPSVPFTSPKAEDGDGAETDPDLVITNARMAEPADGLLSTPELIDLYATPGRPRSAYDLGQRIMAEKDVASVRRCGGRYEMPDARLGAFEPEWTSYTHFCKVVLDYIFIIDPPHRVSSITRLLQPLKTDDMDPGLPRKGVSGSDHVSLAAEIQWHNV